MTLEEALKKIEDLTAENKSLKKSLSKEVDQKLELNKHIEKTEGHVAELRKELENSKVKHEKIKIDFGRFKK